MWRWHALEEVEHKAVAFDTFTLATGDLPGWRRWLLRSVIMGVATGLLFSNVAASMASMFKTDGIAGPRTWGRVFAFLFARPGILRQIFSDYLAYFRPGFHPWAIDDRALIAQFDPQPAPA